MQTKIINKQILDNRCTIYSLHNCSCTNQNCTPENCYSGDSHNENHSTFNQIYFDKQILQSDEYLHILFTYIILLQFHNLLFLSPSLSLHFFNVETVIIVPGKIKTHATQKRIFKHSWNAEKCF